MRFIANNLPRPIRNSAPGPMVVYVPGVWEAWVQFPTRFKSKTLKTILGAPLLSIWHQKCRPWKTVSLPIIDLKCYWVGCCIKVPAIFWCGSTISITSKHHRNMTEIILKVALNLITHSAHAGNTRTDRSLLLGHSVILF